MTQEETIEAKDAVINQLKALVVAAFAEGFIEGQDPDRMASHVWKQSETSKSLAEIMGEKV